MTIKIWLSKNSEVSVREQIIAQISLGIVSGDLKAGDKLPSTRELARRFQIHQNTVSAAYRELAERHSVEFKKGSGVYVRGIGDGEVVEDALESIINRCFHEAAAHGYSSAEVKSRLQKRLAARPAKRFLVVESDAELRKILMAEISAAVHCTVDGASFEDLTENHLKDNTQTLLLFDIAKKTTKNLTTDKNCIYLKANSVPDSMTGKTRPSENDLIAIVSGWEKFLTLAKMFLLAARVAPETLVLRQTNQTNWKNGLQAASMIICDSATARQFPDDERVRIFQLIADSSLDELRESIG